MISDGTTASISEGPQVSTEETPMLNLTVNQVSATAVVQASATSGGSTTVNAYRIHIPVPAGTQFTEIDSFAHASTQGALYVAVTNQTDTKSAIDEIMVVTDGTDAYNLRFGINTDSATTDLVLTRPCIGVPCTTCPYLIPTQVRWAITRSLTLGSHTTARLLTYPYLVGQVAPALT